MERVERKKLTENNVQAVIELFFLRCISVFLVFHKAKTALFSDNKKASQIIDLQGVKMVVAERFELSTYCSQSTVFMHKN